MNIISAQNFVNLLNEQPATAVVDVRTHAEIENEKLSECHPLPLQDLTESSFQAALSHLQQAGADCNNVYLLCQSGKRAEMAISKLKDTKLACKLFVIEGGMNAAKAAGADVIQGSRNTISLERQVRIAAGLLVLAGVVLGFTTHNHFYYLAGFVGAGLTFAGITDTCAMGMLLARMPWNKAKTTCSTT